MIYVFCVSDTSPSQTRQSFTISSSKTAETRPTFQMLAQSRACFQSPCLFPGAIRPRSQVTSILPVQFRLCYEMPSSRPVQTRPNLKLSSPVSASVPIPHHSNMISLARDAPSNNIHTRNIRNTYQYYVNVDRSVNSVTSLEDGNKLTLQYIGTKLNTGTPKVLGLERNITVKKQVGGLKKENVYLTKTGKVGRPKKANVSGKVGRPKKDTLFRTKAGKVGRPRKENCNSTESRIVVEKKSVGRPKKSVDIGRTKFKDSENIQRPFGRFKKKRPVGRPRKYNLITESNGLPAKRPVGRPKKFGLWGNRKYHNIQLKAKDLTPQLQSGAISKRIRLTHLALKPSTQTKQNFAVHSEEPVSGTSVQTDYFVKPKTLCLPENISGKMHIASPTQSHKSGKYSVKGNMMINLSTESTGSSATTRDKSDICPESSPTQSDKSDIFPGSSPRQSDKIDAMCAMSQARTNKVNRHDSTRSSPDGRKKILDMSPIVDKCNTSLLQKQLQFTKPVVELRKIDDLGPYSVSPDKKSSEKYCGKMQLKDMTISQSCEGRQQVEEETKGAFCIHEKPPGEVPINHKRSEEFECCKNLCDKSVVEFIDEYKSVNNCPSDGSPVNSDKQLEQVGDKCAVSDQIDTSHDGFDKTKTTTFFIPKYVKPLNKGVMKRGRGRPRKKKDYAFKFSVCPIKPLNKEFIKMERGRPCKKKDNEGKNGSLCLSVNTEEKRGKQAESSKIIESVSNNMKGVSSANTDSPKEKNTITKVGTGLTDFLAKSTEQDKNPNDYSAQRKTQGTDSVLKVKKKSPSSRTRLKISDLVAMMPTKRQVGRPRYDDVSQFLLGIKSDVKKVTQSKKTNNVLHFDSLESFDFNDVMNDLPLNEEENTHLIETINCLKSEVGVSPPCRDDCDSPSSEVVDTNSRENEGTPSNGNGTLILQSGLHSDDLELKNCKNSKSKALSDETTSVIVGSQLDISHSETTKMSVASQCDNVSINFKNVVSTDMESDGQQKQAIKRNRGRPRKDKTVVQDIVKIERPVGRPRKADNMECYYGKF